MGSVKEPPFPVALFAEFAFVKYYICLLCLTISQILGFFCNISLIILQIAQTGVYPLKLNVLILNSIHSEFYLITKISDFLRNPSRDSFIDFHLMLQKILHYLKGNGTDHQHVRRSRYAGIRLKKDKGWKRPPHQ